MMNILVNGSLAIDRIMQFEDQFEKNILPDELSNLNISFTAKTLNEYFGGTAGNISYGLAKLGHKPTIIASIGSDGDEYLKNLSKLEIDISQINIVDTDKTAGAYILTDSLSNQITFFYAGAMLETSIKNFKLTSNQNTKTIAIISAGNVNDMLSLTNLYKTHQIPYIFDPGQSLPLWNKNNLLEAITGSNILISNEYEFGLIKNILSNSEIEIRQLTENIITTLGKQGSRIILNAKDPNKSNIIKIGACSNIKTEDPTGAGDAFRSGLIDQLSRDQSLIDASKFGTTCASFCIETKGPQTYSLSNNLIKERLNTIEINSL